MVLLIEFLFGMHLRLQEPGAAWCPSKIWRNHGETLGKPWGNLYKNTALQKDVKHRSTACNIISSTCFFRCFTCFRRGERKK